MSDSAAVISSTCLLANSPTLQVGLIWNRASRRDEVFLPIPKNDSRDLCSLSISCLAVQCGAVVLWGMACLDEIGLGKADSKNKDLSGLVNWFS